MSIPLQIAIDCAEPHALARFWAEAIGYEIERHDALVRRMLEQGYATEDDVTEVDGLMAWREAAACVDPDGRQPRLLFQVVPEGKATKNRVHLDLHVGAERMSDEIARLEGLGARRLWDGRQGPLTWVTMADPEGNEFCLA